MTTAHNAQAPTATPAPGAIAAPVAAKSATPTKATPVRATPARRAPTKAVAKKTPVAPKVASVKPATTAKAKTIAVAPPKVEKITKPKKPKLVRDSFTIPKDEYAVIETLKQRAAALAQPAKKSELLRAGLKVLAGMSDSALRDALKAVPLLKTGRPKTETAAAIANTKPGTKSPGKK